MKLAGRLFCFAEVFLLGTIMCFIYALLGGDRVVSNLRRGMPGVMQFSTATGIECEDTVCLHRLSVEEKTQYDTCYNRSVSTKYANKFGPVSEGTCHFQYGTTRFPVGLGSFQGSGNTWLRGLLQKVTGICTGKY